MNRALHTLVLSSLLLGVPAAAQHAGDPVHDHEHVDDPTYGGLLEAPEPDMAPEEIGDLTPAVRVHEGDPEGLRVEVEREPSDAFPGLRARVRVTNDGNEPRTIDAVFVTEESLARPWVPPTSLATLVFEGESFDRCEVTPLRVRRESRRVLVAALPSRRVAFVAGFPAPNEGGGGGAAITTFVSITPGLALTVKFSAEVRYEGRTLAPGETLVTPDLLVQFAPEAWVGLTPFLTELEESEEVEPFDTSGVSSAPIVAVTTNEGLVTLHRNPRGRALDLLEGDGRCFVWRRDTDEIATVELDNPDSVTRLVHLRFADLGLPASDACELVGPDGSLGLYRGAATLALPPASSQPLRVEPRAERTPPDVAWEFLALVPPDVGLPVTVERFEADDPTLAERLEHAFEFGGVVIANHRGSEVLEPIPPALAATFAPRVFPVHAHAVSAPRGDEAAFLERAANVEWLLGLPRREPGAGAWLVSREAGWDATPIEGAIVDGLPAGRGFCVPTSPGLAIVTLDLTPAELAALAESLRERDARADVQKNIGRAMRKLRSGAPGGLFDALPYDRHAPVDLAPANPFAARQWSLQVQADAKAVESRTNGDGTTATEDVLLFSRPMVFALDVPTGANDRIAVVLRRSASNTLEDWAFELDATAIGDLRRSTPPTPAGWIDEVFTFGAAEIRQRPRLAFVVRPVGGVLPLARLAFFRVTSLPGTPLRSMNRSLVRTDGPVRVDLDANGHVLRMAGEAFLDGYGFRDGGALEVDLEGRYVSLLARVGLDADAPDGAPAVVRILVDGVESKVTALLRAGEAPVPLTIPVEGARVVRLEIEAESGHDRDTLVDLVDARLVTR